MEIFDDHTVEKLQPKKHIMIEKREPINGSEAHNPAKLYSLELHITWLEFSAKIGSERRWLSQAESRTT
jgi:hypothetical protein